MIYGNITDWRAYASERGDSGPTDAADATASAALLRASDYIRTRYVIRAGLLDTDPNVIEATYIAASIDLPSPGFWAKTFTAKDTKVLTKVEGISWTPIKANGYVGSDAILPTSPAIEALLFGGTGFNVPAQFVV